jgi:hypothetical protein
MDSITILALPSNLDGFTWSSNKLSNLVRDEWDFDPPGGRMVWSNGVTDVFVDRDWRTKSGRHSLRFFYPAGEEWTEQRFNLGGAYPELWFRYWIRVPVNYTHPPSTGGAARNQKWLALWMDDYETQGLGPTVVWGLWPSLTADSSSDIAVAYKSEGTGGAGGYQQYKRFITDPDDRGRWMQVVYQLVASTTYASNDGIIRFWRRWENESEFEKFTEYTNIHLPFPTNGPDGWNAGYLMGWANAPYSENTEFLLDNFTVSTTSLIGI